MEELVRFLPFLALEEALEVVSAAFEIVHHAWLWALSKRLVIDALLVVLGESAVRSHLFTVAA